MSMKCTGRRGLFGLLAAAPVAAVATTARADGITVNVVNLSPDSVDVRIVRGTWPIEVEVESVLPLRRNASGRMSAIVDEIDGNIGRIIRGR